jgi:hypothetical protein
LIMQRRTYSLKKNLCPPPHPLFSHATLHPNIHYQRRTHLGHEKLPGRAGSRKITLSLEEEDVLKDWNKWDMKLYEHVKTMAADRAKKYAAINKNSDLTLAQLTSPLRIEQCAKHIEEKWGEPISRQARHLRCKM